VSEEIAEPSVQVKAKVDENSEARRDLEPGDDESAFSFGTRTALLSARSRP
jgi:hypothetical protein